ncbi:MAG: phytanoyl-CoA dioxygenase family protein [Bacteroidia bacterium]|nr:phytanoyl-CoA dioxygenase family protein [Bacteroidia bacterium]
METNPILLDKALDDELKREGYVVVPFLSPQQVIDLKTFFIQNHTDALPGFYATAHSPNLGFRKAMNDRIIQEFSTPIQSLFSHCKPLGGSFVVKNNQGSEVLRAHQDWNIVDETRFRSFNIWVPLVDLSSQNGAITVLPGSHAWIENYRGPNIPDDFEQVNSQLWDRMLTLNMKAGQALIYDHRLFHASHANTSDFLRMACVFGIIPENAEMLYYYGNGNQVEVYKSSVDFFMNGNIQEGNKQLEMVKTIPRPIPNLEKLGFTLSKPASSNFWSRLFGRG